MVLSLENDITFTIEFIFTFTNTIFFNLLCLLLNLYYVIINFVHIYIRRNKYLHNKKNIRVSFQHKLLLIIVFTIAVPMVIAGYVMMKNQNKMIEDEVIRTTNKEIAQISDIMSNDFNHLKSITNLFYLDEDINKMLIDYKNDTIDNIPRDVMNKSMEKYTAGMSKIRFESLLVTNDGMTYGSAKNQNSQLNLNITYKSWYTALERIPTNILWISDPDLDQIFSTPDYPYVYIIRKIHNRGTWESTGTLILGIPENEIRKMYSGYVTDNQSIFILDNDNNLISMENNLSLPNIQNTTQEYIFKHSGNLTKTFGERQLLLSQYTINTTQWKVFTFNELNHLTSTFRQINYRYLITIFIFFGFSLVLAIFSLERFTRPIKSLFRTMEKIKEGKLDVEVPITTNDEIGDLAIQFNSMVEHINILMSEVVTEQQLKREAEMLSLQTQINPHFLYNTFASIRYLIYTEKKEDADKIILAFIRLMKNILSDTKEFISIEKEIELLKDYVYIQNIAFSNKVQVNYNIDDDIKGCKTIKLLLQPIVENAFLHGLKPKKEDGILTIHGFSVDDDIYFEIVDNGIGFDTTISENPSSKTSTSIGFKNVSDRISLTFGKEYYANLESELGVGTKVTLKIPKISNREEFTYYEYIDR